MSNFIVAFITPPFFDVISSGCYFVLVGFCVISGVFVFSVYPDAAHFTLKQFAQVFGDTVPDSDKAEALASLQLAPGKIPLTTSSEVSDDGKLLFTHKGIPYGSRASSSTAVGDITIMETSTNVKSN
jgi:hypothetical protein